AAQATPPPAARCAGCAWTRGAGGPGRGGCGGGRRDVAGRTGDAPAARYPAGRWRGDVRRVPGNRPAAAATPLMADLFAAPQPVRVPVRSPEGATFPVRRIFCVGRNFADHAREMGATPADPAARGEPVLFCKPADAVVTGDEVPYPRGTTDLHHEVELVVALGTDAPDGVLDPADAESLVIAYGVGLALT